VREVARNDLLWREDKLENANTGVSRDEMVDVRQHRAELKRIPKNEPIYRFGRATD
jgi:hypothetical protein